MSSHVDHIKNLSLALSKSCFWQELCYCKIIFQYSKILRMLLQNLMFIMKSWICFRRFCVAIVNENLIDAPKFICEGPNFGSAEIPCILCCEKKER